MSGEQRAWCIVGCVAILALTGVIALAVVQGQTTERLKFSQGYEQVTVPGSGVPVWQKAK
jgi:hypothetical protein